MGEESEKREVDFLKKQVDVLEKKLDTLMCSIPGGVLIHSAETGKIIQVTESLLTMFGCDEHTFRDHYFNNFDLLIYKGDRMATKELISTQLEFMDHVEVSFRIKGIMNEIKYIEYRGKRIEEMDGSFLFYGVLNDVSDRVAVQKQLQLRNEELYMETQRYKLLREAIDDITFDYFVETDSASFHYPGVGNQEKIYPNFMKNDVIRELLQSEDYEQTISQIKALIEKPQKKIYEFRAKLDATVEEAKWYRAYLASFASNSGEVVRIVGSFKNITSELEEREALRKKANVDFMTGLLNKTTMENRVKARLSKTISKKYRALLIIDADKFKRINDSLGHLAGDAVIQFIAKQIKKNFRENDLVGRIGGDEFMVYLETDSTDAVLQKAGKINEAVREPVMVDGINIQMSCSIGIAFASPQMFDYESLFAAADQSLYQVKKDGRDHYEYCLM